MTVSKMVTDRQKSARAVVAAAQTHGARAGDGVAALLGADHRAPTVKMIQAMGSVLDKACTTMVRADEHNQMELADDADPRARRDAAAAELRTALVEMREVISAVFGPGYVTTLGLEGNTPFDPDQLARLGKRVHENLQQHSPPQPRFTGMCFDLTFWSARLDKVHDPLKKALEDVSRESREAEATQVAKNRAIAEYDQTFGLVASFVSSMLTIAGEPELARRVRPSTRRPGQTEEDAGDSGPQVVGLSPDPVVTPTATDG